MLDILNLLHDMVYGEEDNPPKGAKIFPYVCVVVFFITVIIWGISL